ncbi:MULTISPECIES: hypothetical protein [unclassified Guyparkeria]|uniref:hypothetical protein n=1 Tax=unclassified Guyparkeria TaxID=2626246 RepID=UPI0012E367B7|nr:MULTISPECIES: hypothetical protein [unclassified Guyparkeria]
MNRSLRHWVHVESGYSSSNPSLQMPIKSLPESAKQLIDRVFAPCDPPALNEEERQSELSGQIPESHFNSSGMNRDDFEQILDLISDQTSVRTRAYHRIVVSVAVTIIMLWFWKVPIDEIRVLGVTGAETHIPNVLVSINAFLLLTLFLYLVSAWIDHGVSKAKTQYASERLARAAYHLSFIKDNIACGNKIHPNGFSNISRVPGSALPESHVRDRLMSVERSLIAVNLLHRRNKYHRFWKIADPILTTLLVMIAGYVLIRLLIVAA